MNTQYSSTNLQNFIEVRLELDPNKILFTTNSKGEIEYEIFKDIPDYIGFYQCSNFGRIKSLKRFVKRSNHYIEIKESIIRQFKININYLAVKLVKDAFKKCFQTHQLVAMTFLDHKPCGFKIVVDHKNNLGHDNKLSNLQLISNRENSSKDKKGGTSEYIGVSWNKHIQRWKSCIVFNKKDIVLGHFKNELEASNYYQNALKSIKNGTEIKIKRKINTSKYRGVYKIGNKWAIQFKKKYLGTFPTEEEAYQALLIAQKE